MHESVEADLVRFWMLSEGDRERTRTGLIPLKLPVAWPTAGPWRMWANRVGWGVTRINREANRRVRWMVVVFSTWRMRNVRTMSSHIHEVIHHILGRCKIGHGVVSFLDPIQLDVTSARFQHPKSFSWSGTPTTVSSASDRLILCTFSLVIISRGLSGKRWWRNTKH